MREYPCKPYLLVEHPDGWELRESVSGLSVKRRRFGDAMAEMHRQLIARRDELRECAALSAAERQELDALEAKFSDAFLRSALAA